MSKVEGVDPVAPPDLARIRRNIEDYGEALVGLDDATWETSVCQWMGDHWEVLVDLPTREGGVSDLVLDLQVFETPGGYRFVIHMVYVP